MWHENPSRATFIFVMLTIEPASRMNVTSDGYKFATETMIHF